MIRCCLLAVCLCSALSADGLTDLRGALARYQGQDAMKAQLGISSWSRGTEGNKPKDMSSSETLIVEEGPMGLRITCPPAVLTKVRQEARVKGPEGHQPTLKILGKVGFLQAAAYCNAGSSLMEQLEDAQFEEEKQELWQGHPARLLTFKLKAQNGSEMGAKMNASGSLKIWVDGEGVPLASESQRKMEAGIFLIKVKSTERTATDYTRLGSRLLVLRQVEEMDGTAIGQHIQTKQVMSLQLQ